MATKTAKKPAKGAKNSLKVKKSDAIALIVALGLKNAKGWPTNKILDSITKNLGAMDDGSVKITDDKLKALLKALKTADKADQKVELIDDGKPAPAAKAETKPAKSGKKAAAVEDDEDEEEEESESEDDESDDEDEEEEGDDDSDEEEEEEGDEEEDDDEEESDDDEEDEDDEEEESDDDDESEDDDEEESDDEDEEDEEPKAKKKPPLKDAKKGKDKKGGKDKGEKPAKKKSADPVEKDKFGMRLGSRAARLNKQIIAKSRSAKKIMEKAEYDKPINGHLRKLIELEFVAKDDDGYYDVAARKAEKKAAKGGDAKPAKKKKK